MTEKSSPLVRLDSHQNDNWTSRAVPVAILNTDSTLHDRIAFSWSLAKNLHVLSVTLDQHMNSEIQDVAALFGSQLQPLEVMLKKLGSDTNPSQDFKRDASTDGGCAAEQ